MLLSNLAAARLLLHGFQILVVTLDGGIIVTTLLGVGGGLLGGFIGTRLGFGDVTGLNLPSLGLAVGGAVLVLLGYRTVRRR